MLQRRWSKEVDSFEVLHYIKSCGEIGRTNKEIARHFEISKQKASSRIRTLRTKQCIIWNGKKRASDDSGQVSHIWVAIENAK